jgi:hypothetical protein
MLLFLEDVRVWEVLDWSLLVASDNPPLENVLGLSFDKSDTLTMVTMTGNLYKLPPSATETSVAWKRQSTALLQSTSGCLEWLTTETARSSQ